MRTYHGRVAELQLDPAGRTSARIACPPGAVPAPGQYLLAAGEGDLLGVPLFYAGPAVNGFLAAPPMPDSWAPGTPLALRGPLGRGFRLPAGLKRLALVAAWEGVSRLLPLAIQALDQNAAVTLFTASPGTAPPGTAPLLPDLPLSVEAYPLEAAAEAVRWAGFLAVEVQLEGLPGLGALLGLGPGERLPVPGQALVLAPMPCAGLADCGVCAVMALRDGTARRSWKLACKDGPVFDLKDLLD